MNRPVTSSQDVAVQRMSRLLKSKLQMPSRIYFGLFVRRDLGRLASEIQSKGAVLILARKSSAADPSWQDDLRIWVGRGAVEFAGCHGEPSAESVDALATRARTKDISLVIAIGGGSVIDAGKAVAALATNGGSVEDYLEGPQGARPLAADPLPLIAVPTTAGTGSEMTRNAVVLSHRQGCKRSLRDDRLFPRLALIDPELCLGAPREVTVASGLDAITQLIESAITIRRNSEVTALAMEALGGMAETLQRCVDAPEDLDARALMSAAASISGACLANSGLGLAHGVAAALGAKCGMPHGLACGILLPHALRWNLRACPAEIAQVLAALFAVDSADQADPSDLVNRLGEWVARLGIPRDLRHLRLTPADLDALSALSMGSSMSGNPVPMTPADVREFLSLVSI